MRSVYLMDVVEECGHQCALASFWDIGTWAAQDRQWRPLPPSVGDSLFKVPLGSSH